MSCPFKHLWGAAGGKTPPGHPAKKQDPPEAAAEEMAGLALVASGTPAAPPAEQAVESGVGKCPFAHDSAASHQPAAADTAAGDASPAPAAAVCPFNHGAATSDGFKDTAATGEDGACKEAGAEPATCPLGFGRAPTGPRMTPLHCIICRSLLHDCAVTSCGHRFCAGCIGRLADCPLCGADIEGTAPDAETQAAVDKFIAQHCDEPGALQDLESGRPEAAGNVSAAAPADPPAAAAAGDAGALPLQLGLRALAAGNLDSAQNRFAQCRQRLVEELILDEGPADQAAIRTRLGTVHGCLGDCCRARGDWRGAEQCYHASAEALQAAGGSIEVQHALSVTLNKLGELHHSQGRLEEAVPLYRQSLAIRRRRLEAVEGEEGLGGGPAQRAAAALDVAVGCIKVADALQALGGDEQAAEVQALLAEATELAAAAGGGASAAKLLPLPPQLDAKLAAVKAQLARLWGGGAAE